MNKTVDSNPSDKLHLGKFLAWKGRDVSSSAVQVIVLGYLMLFATDTLHLSPAFVGGLLMISKIINAITNLFAGFLVDNTNTKLGKGRPYEIAIIGVWICTVLLFSCPPEWSTTVKSIWIIIMYFFIFSVFNSLLTAAQTPYMIRAFPSRNQVIKVSSYGGVISMLGAMIVSITFPIMMGKLATSGAGWNKLILIYAIPLCIIGILRFIFVKEDTSIYAGTSSEKIKIKDVVTMFKANKFLWFYAGMIGLFNIIQGMAVQAQYFKYVVGNISLQGIMGFLTILMLPIMFFFPKLMKKLSVSQLIQYSAIISGVGYLINFFAKDSIPLLIMGSLLSGLAVLPLSYLGNVIIMNLAGYNEQIGLQRMEGSTNVSVGFVGAVFNGIGTGLVGLLLGISGYIGSANVQSESALFMIRSVYALIPLACMFGIYLFSKKLAALEELVK
ncbi:MFS transporter [Streptococcus parasuis]|uniref:MFS transporter n=1 Tax=Streptococcus parasuis TaxID=1501662 RepID=UPI0028A038EE|nr:MFS transporter [Streptococcus parasuis]